MTHGGMHIMARKTTKKEAAPARARNDSVATTLEDQRNDAQCLAVKRFVDQLVDAPDRLRANVARTIPRIVPVGYFMFAVTRLLDYLGLPQADSRQAAARKTLLEL